MAHARGIFLMGDAQVMGFPIRYASPGFEQARCCAPAGSAGRGVMQDEAGPRNIADHPSCSLCAETSVLSSKGPVASSLGGRLPRKLAN